MRIDSINIVLLFIAQNLIIPTLTNQYTKKTFHYSNENFKVDIRRRIESKGFHRFLTTEFRFNSTENKLIESKCKLLLVEYFDRNIYVDVFELKQKTYSKMYSFYLSNKVNTETAEYKSQEFQLYLYIDESIKNCYRYSKIPCKITIKLPIHVRYHAPYSFTEQINKTEQSDSDKQYFNFTLHKPRIFVTNCSIDLEENNKQLNKNENYLISNTSVELPCKKETKLHYDHLFFFEHNNNQSLMEKMLDNVCVWDEIHFQKMHSSDSLIILLPVGNRDHETIILIVTLVLLTFLALSIANYVRRNFSNCKLN